MRKQVYIVIAILLLMASCAKDDSETALIRGQRFSVGVKNYADEESGESTRASDASQVVGTVISQLQMAIYDANGDLVTNQLTNHSPDFGSFVIEGLIDGAYTAVFMGVGEVRTAIAPTITVPSRLGEEWIPKISDASTTVNEYFYAQSNFAIVNGCGVPAAIGLSRIVGCLSIEPVYADKQWTPGSLTDVTVSFDKEVSYTTHLTGDTYVGANSAWNEEVLKSMNLYTLPSIDGKLSSGKVVLQGLMNDGKPYEVVYEFKVRIERNKRAVLRPVYLPNSDQFGTLRLYDHDRNAMNSHRIFQDKDAYRSVASHSFRPMNPLVVRLLDKQRIRSTFYSLLPVRDVMLLARRPNDSEFFELAWFESILALEERTVNLSEQPLNRLYRTESGNVVVIDKLTNDMEYKYRSEDPLMKKIMAITWPCEIRFVQPSGDTLTNAAGTLPLRAVHAREAVAMFTNMAAVLSNPDWKHDMLVSEKKIPFKDNNRVVSCENELFPRIWNANYKGKNFIVIHVMTPNSAYENYGVATIGSGEYLAMQQHVYTGHYPGIGDEGMIITPFHEYSHTLGYNHNGNLTYNEFTYITLSVCRNLTSNLITPYPNHKLLNSRSNPTLYKKGPNGTIL